MDEAAAKLRVALYSMPSDLKKMKSEVDHLMAEEEQAGTERDYERAARKKPKGCAWKPISLKNAINGKPNISWMKSWTNPTSPRSFRNGLAFRSIK
jgi:ATP-dependent Clp protease ATP-binding subunit ClpA